MWFGAAWGGYRWSGMGRVWADGVVSVILGWFGLDLNGQGWFGCFEME